MDAKLSKEIEQFGGRRSYTRWCVGAALVGLTLMYLWMTGFQHYDGIVSKKAEIKSRGQRSYPAHILYVDDEEYEVDPSLYGAVQEGDHVRQSLLMPWAFVNNKRVWFKEHLWCMVAWILLGVFLVSRELWRVWFRPAAGGRF
ncbi:MAG: hypothetical protein KAY24_05340 [Candidatus Eisenbacteria sp.]|nr:hypothetical protein [Candidatus Eisenbacteria bacterium]